MSVSPVSATLMPPSASSPAVAFTVGVETSVELPSTFLRTVWKFTSPDEMCQATFRRLVEGSSDVSSMVMRLSGLTWTTVPSKKVISALAPAPVRTRSLFLSSTLESAVTHSNVPTAFTFTLPSMEVKCAVVAAGAGSVTAALGGAFFK
jgi:hypothetical protein